MRLTAVPRRADGLCHSAQPPYENHTTLGRVTLACGQGDNRGANSANGMEWTGPKQASVAVIPAGATLYFALSVTRFTQVVAQKR